MKLLCTMEMRRELPGFGVIWEIKEFITPNGITLAEVCIILKKSDTTLYQQFFEKIAWEYYSNPECYKSQSSIGSR